MGTLFIILKNRLLTHPHAMRSLSPPVSLRFILGAVYMVYEYIKQTPRVSKLSLGVILFIEFSNCYAIKPEQQPLCR